MLTSQLIRALFFKVPVWKFWVVAVAWVESVRQVGRAVSLPFKPTANPRIKPAWAPHVKSTCMDPRIGARWNGITKS